MTQLKNTKNLLKKYNKMKKYILIAIMFILTFLAKAQDKRFDFYVYSDPGVTVYLK